MSSAFASALVRENLVAAPQVVRSVERQFLFAGSLDTCLLEEGAIAKQLLVAALGRIAELPVLSQVALEQEVADLRLQFPMTLFERFAALPLAVDNKRVKVLVGYPVNRRAIADLAAHFRRVIEVCVGPEYLLTEAALRIYGVPLPLRFSRLLAKLDRQEDTAVEMNLPKPTLTGSFFAVTGSFSAVEDSDPSMIPEFSAPPASVSQPVVVQATAATAAPPVVVAATVATPPVSPPEVVSAPTLTPPPIAPAMLIESSTTVETKAVTPSEIAATAPPEVQVVANTQAIVVEAAPHQDIAAPQVLLPDPTQLVVMPPLTEDLVLSVPQAIEAIERATQRDQIFESLCRGLRSRLNLVAVFLVHGESADLKMALAETWLPPSEIHGVSMSLAAASPFRATASGRAPFLGKIGSDANSRELLKSLGRKKAQAALLFPIVLKERSVALVYGDNNGRPLDATLLAETSRPIAAAGRALQRLILNRRAGHDDDLSQQSIPLPPPAPAPVMQAKAVPAAAATIPPAAPAIATNTVAATPPLPLLAADDTDLPMQPTTLFVNPIPVLRQQLMDEDSEIRLKALQGIGLLQRTIDREKLLHWLLKDLAGNHPNRRSYACDALGELRDVGAVEQLIEMVKHADETSAQAARQALVKITKQDFAGSRWRWRSWWEKHQDKPRVEWMFDGLSHSRPDVRMSAIEELRSLSQNLPATEQGFDKHIDLSKSQREAARRKWLAWWHKNGQGKKLEG